MQRCENPNCEYPANPDPSISRGFCCEKCEGRHNGEEWAMGGKKKHTAYCTSKTDPGGYGGGPGDGRAAPADIRPSTGYGGPPPAAHGSIGATLTPAAHGSIGATLTPAAHGSIGATLTPRQNCGMMGAALLTPRQGYVEDFGKGGKGGGGFPDQPLNSDNLPKCAHPDCEYAANSDPSISKEYCCEKCEGVHKNEAWAEGGKRHYKSCEKKSFIARFGADWAPAVVEEPKPRGPLERHEGAQRDTRPAWMTRGVGVNLEIIGETTGDMVKPGMTKADMEALESRVRRSDSPDPMGDFMRRDKEKDVDSPPRSRSPVPKKAPLPDQKEAYYSEWK